MESCRSEPLKFDCNKKIDINPKEYWEEIMQLTFLNNELNSGKGYRWEGEEINQVKNGCKSWKAAEVNH